MAEVVNPDLDDDPIAAYQALANAVGFDLEVYIVSGLTAIAAEAGKGK